VLAKYSFRARFQGRIVEALVDPEERKRGDAKSTRGGFTFEDAN